MDVHMIHHLSTSFCLLAGSRANGDSVTMESMIRVKEFYDDDDDDDGYLRNLPISRTNS